MIKKSKSFLIIWVNSLFLLLVISTLGFGFYLKETRAGFGDLTGQISVPCKIKYLSNYPSELNLDEQEVLENVVGDKYLLSSNTFVLSGYSFVSWNTKRDGTGESYNEKQEIPLEDDITFYAQWELLIVYGDVNQNGEIDTGDYELIENLIANGMPLTSSALKNADVNEDGKVDLIDADIIKQVCLGTEGYTDGLINKPIMKYEIYENNVETDTEDDDVSEEVSGESDKKEESEKEEVKKEETKKPTGNSSGGNGTGNSGTGTDSNTSSGSSNSSTNSDSSDKKDNVLDKEDIDDNKVIDKDNVSNNELDLNMNNYEVDEDNKDRNKIYVVIIVFCIGLLAIRSIYHVIYKFRQNEDNKVKNMD